MGGGMKTGVIRRLPSTVRVSICLSVGPFTTIWLDLEARESEDSMPPSSSTAAETVCGCIHSGSSIMADVFELGPVQKDVLPYIR